MFSIPVDYLEIGKAGTEMDLTEGDPSGSLYAVTKKSLMVLLHSDMVNKNQLNCSD